MSSFSETFIIFSQNLPGNNFTIRSYFCHIKLPQRKLCTRNQFLTLNHFFRIAPPYPPPQSSQTFLVQHISLASQSLFPLLVNFNMKRDKNRVAQFTQNMISRNQISTGSVLIFGRPTDSNFYLLNISKTLS